jgi:hypothetical protein
MKYKIIWAAALIFCICDGIHAQDKNLTVLSWEIGFPGNNNNFLSKTSFEGGKIEYRHFIKDDLSVGVFLDWNSYYEYFPTATYTNNEQTQAVTTDMYRYIYTLPFGVNAHYYLKTGGLVRPFFGLSLGAQYAEQKLYYNIFYNEAKNWGFMARPELGVIIKPAPLSAFGLLLGGSYSFATNGNSNYGFNTLQSFNIQIGLVFMK